MNDSFNFLAFGSGNILRTNVVINETASTVMLVVLLLILCSCLARKEKSRSSKAFIYWSGNMVCLFVCQLAMWITNRAGISMSNMPGLFIANRFLFVLDFWLYNLMIPLFYHYINASVFERSQPSPQRPRFLHNVEIALFAGTGLITLFFASSLWTGWLYHIDENGFAHYTAAYNSVMVFILLLGYIIISTELVHFRKHFGTKKTIILFSYIFVPLFSVPIDYKYNLNLSYIMYAIVTLVIFIEVDVQQSREHALLEAKIAKHENELTNMRVNLMMSQIQPHFLYNALSSISYLCTKEPKEAEAATNEFADYLKANLRSIKSTCPIPFEMELQHVESYLKIQKRRFLERMCVVYDVQAYSFRIPALALQTMVENAVRHGVETRFEPTTICVSSKETPTAYIVTVQDDGPGFDVTAPLKEDRPHLGIESTRIRLAEMVNGTLDIVSEPGKGTTVTISIPKQKEAEKQ